MIRQGNHTRIVTLSLDDLDLFGLSVFTKPIDNIIPLVFINVGQCLELLLDNSLIDLSEEEFKTCLEDVELYNGELELKLSFFTNAIKWQ